MNSERYSSFYWIAIWHQISHDVLGKWSAEDERRRYRTPLRERITKTKIAKSIIPANFLRYRLRDNFILSCTFVANPHPFPQLCRFGLFFPPSFEFWTSLDVRESHKIQSSTATKCSWKAGNSWKIALMKTLLTTCDCDSFATCVLRDYQYNAWHLAGIMVSLAFGNNTQSKKFWVRKKNRICEKQESIFFFYHPSGWERNFLKKMPCAKVRLFF